MNISYSASDLYNKISSNGNTFISSYRKRVREADTNVQDLQEDIESFRKNIRNLKNYDSDTITKSKLEKYLNEFADSYNELKDSAEKITDKELSETLAKLEDFMGENEKSLKKLGLKEANGEWSFDSEVFQETKDKDINKLFEGNDAIFKQMDKLMRKVEKQADEEEYQMVLRSFHSVTQYSQEEMGQASSSYYVYGVVGTLQKSNTEVQNYDASTGASSENIKLGIDGFLWGYNDVVKDATDSISDYVSYMIDKTKENAISFDKLGITVKDDGMLEYYSDAIIDDAFKEGYAALFGESATYGNLMKTYTKNVFDITMKKESLGITIDSYA